MLASVGAWAQTSSSHLKLLASDQTELSLPTTFSVPGSTAVKQVGDYFFTSGNSTALFSKAVAAPAPVRLLQRGDPVPGIIGARCESFGPLVSSNNGLLAVTIFYAHSNPLLSGSSIFILNGESWTKIASSTDVASGTGGFIFGAFTLAGVNDAGDVAFMATVRSEVGVSVNTPTFYIAPAGGVPVKILAQGDMVPGTTTWPMTIVSAGGFNNLGQLLIQGFINGGTNGSVLLVGTTTGLTTVVIFNNQGGGTPQPSPGSGTFTSLSFGPLLLNNAGQIAFGTANTIWVYTPSTGLARVMAAGHVVPPPPGDLGGTIIGSVSGPAALNDAGDVVFQGSIAGDSTNGNTTYNKVLFRLVEGTLHTVAYATQAAPGTTNPFSTTFDSISMNASGQVSFRNALSATEGPNAGFFTRAPGNPITKIALAGEAVPAAGGGTFGLPAFTRTRTLDNGSVYLVSNVTGGSTYYGEFLFASGTLGTLLTSAEPLPAGHRASLRTIEAGSGGDYAAFIARRTGGPAVVFRVQKSTGVITRVLGEGDVVPGGRIRTVNVLSNGLSVNAAGQVAIVPTLGDEILQPGIFLWDATAGLQKVAIVGDAELTTGSLITGISGPNGYGSAPVNASGQIPFAGILAGAASIFLGAAGSAPRKLAKNGEAAPGGGFFSTLNNPRTLMINDAGQVLFPGSTTAGAQGIYLSTGAGVLSKIVKTGDAAPLSTFSSLPTAFGFNNNGEVLFPALFNNGTMGGYFVGSATAAPQAVAISGAEAPSGGNFEITSLNPDGIINDQGDVVFRASLSGGSADSGLFMRRGPSGPLHTVILQGSPAPETSGTFGTLPSAFVNLPGDFLSLLPSGELLIRTPVDSDGLVPALYRYRTDDLLEKVIVAGELAPGSGGGILTSIGFRLTATPQPTFWAGVLNGSITDAIYSVGEVAADVSLALSGPNKSVTTASTDYNFTVVNHGPSIATGIVMAMPLVSGAQVLQFPGNCSVGDALTCTIPTLVPGASTVVEFQAKYDGTGQMEFTANASANESDPNTTNNASSVETTFHDVVFTLVRTQRTPRNGTSGTQMLTFQIAGLPAQARVEVSCTVTGPMGCRPASRFAAVNGGSATFSVMVNSLRAKRLRASAPSRLTVSIKAGALRRQLDVTLMP